MQFSKKKIRGLCIQLLQDQLLRLEEMMRHAQAEANKETKSSAGDKYETGRSMMQLEKEKFALQHSRVSQELDVVQALDLGVHDEVQEGSLVYTNIGLFFISVGLEPLMVNGKTITCLSLSTPIGKSLEGLEEGDVVDFRDQEIEIWEVH